MVLFQQSTNTISSLLTLESARRLKGISKLYFCIEDGGILTQICVFQKEKTKLFQTPSGKEKENI